MNVPQPGNSPADRSDPTGPPVLGTVPPEMTEPVRPPVMTGALKERKLSQAIQAIRAAGGSDWDRIGDVETYLDEVSGLR